MHVQQRLKARCVLHSLMNRPSIGWRPCNDNLLQPLFAAMRGYNPSTPTVNRDMSELRLSDFHIYNLSFPPLGHDVFLHNNCYHLAVGHLHHNSHPELHAQIQASNSLLWTREPPSMLRSWPSRYRWSTVRSPYIPLFLRSDSLLEKAVADYSMYV